MSVFHNFELIFYGGKCTKLFLIEVFFACILKNKSGKTKELILRFSALKSVIKIVFMMYAAIYCSGAGALDQTLTSPPILMKMGPERPER